MADSEKFQNWMRREVSRIQTGKTIEELVDEMMQEKYLRVEYKDRTGTVWVDEKIDNTVAIKEAREGVNGAELDQYRYSDD